MDVDWAAPADELTCGPCPQQPATTEYKNPLDKDKDMHTMFKKCKHEFKIAELEMVSRANLSHAAIDGF